MSDGGRNRSDPLRGLIWYWVALVVAVVVGLWLGYQNYQSDHYREASQKAQELAASTCRSASDPGRCASEALKAFQQEQYAQRDVTAQQEMAIYTLGVLAITGVGIVLIGLTLRETRDVLDEARKTTKAAEDTVEETRRIGEAQARAYLGVDELKLVWPEHRGYATFKLVIKNFGSTPANRVSFVLDWYWGARGNGSKFDVLAKERVVLPPIPPGHAQTITRDCIDVTIRDIDTTQGKLALTKRHQAESVVHLVCYLIYDDFAGTRRRLLVHSFFDPMNQRRDRESASLYRYKKHNRAT